MMDVMNLFARLFAFVVIFCLLVFVALGLVVLVEKYDQERSIPIEHLNRR